MEALVDDVVAVAVAGEGFIVAGGVTAVAAEVVDGSIEETVGVVLEGVEAAGSVGAVVCEVLAVVVDGEGGVLWVVVEAGGHLREAEEVRGGTELREASGKCVGGGEGGVGGGVGGGQW